MAKPRNPSFDGSAAKAATSGAKALSGSLTELAAKGELSAQSMNQLGAAIGQLNPALGLIAASAIAVYTSFRILKELEIKDALVQVGAGAQVATAEFDRFVARATAGSEESGTLREKMRDLAEAQEFLRGHVEAVNAEVLKQTELVKEGEISESAAYNAIQREIETRKERIVTRQREIEDLQKEIDAQKKANAEAERAAATVRRFNVEIQKENDLFAVLKQGRAQYSIFASKAGAEELQLRQKELGQLQRQYDMQVSLGDQNAVYTLESIGNTQDRIDALEREAVMQERVGAMAESAIAGSAAGAFDTYAAALDKTVSMNALFQSSSDRTLRNVAASTIRNVGRQAAIEGSMEAARALAALAIGNTAGASTHAAAAAGFFAVAAAAGVAAGATSVKAPGTSGGGGRGSGTETGRGGPTINLTVIGNLDTQARKDLGAQLREEFYEGGG